MFFVIQITWHTITCPLYHLLVVVRYKMWLTLLRALMNEEPSQVKAWINS